MATIPWTHAMESDGRIYGFAMDGTCDACGRAVSAPNVVQLCESRARLVAMGVRFVSAMPPEIIVNDDGSCSCSKCYRETTTDAPEPPAQWS